jgi:hypothetical protein
MIVYVLLVFIAWNNPIKVDNIASAQECQRLGAEMAKSQGGGHTFKCYAVQKAR